MLTFSAASSNLRVKTSLRSHSPSSWAFLLYSGKFLFNTRNGDHQESVLQLFILVDDLIYIPKTRHFDLEIYGSCLGLLMC